MNQESRSLLQGALLASFLLLLAACSSSPGSATGPKDGSQTADALDLMQRAEIQFSAGKAEEALTYIDRAFDKSDGLDRQQLGKLNLPGGEANLKFAEQAQAQGRGGALIEGSYIDATNRLQDAARLMPDDARPWAVLCKTRFQRGQWDEMRTAAEKAAELLKAHGEELSPSDTRLLANVLAYDGHAYLRECMDERKAELADDPNAKIGDATYQYAAQARLRFKSSIELDPQQVLAYNWMATCSEWINRPTDAIAVLEMSVKNNPQNDAHHQRLQSLYRRYNRVSELVQVYKKLSEGSRTAKDYYDYYLGLAYQMHADVTRKVGDHEKALQLYESGQAAFQSSARHNPSFKNNCDLACAICEVSKAAMSLDDGEETRAWDQLTTAWNGSHRIAQIDQNGYDRYYDAFNKSYRGLCYQLGDRYREGRLGEAVRYWRAITGRHPTWGPAWNNLGFALRDHGVLLAKNGDSKAATQEWEESWKAYGQAIRHEPQDERIVNDAGLMLVYHLERDYETAERLFKQAIELGDTKLEDMEEDPSDTKPSVRTARRDVEEAVGDAWQNLGVLYKKLGKPEESRKAYENSVRYWSPSLRMQIRVMLKKMAEKGNDKTMEWIAPMAIVGALVPPSSIFEDDIEKIQALLAEGKAEDALDLCEKALDSDSENVELLYLAGRGSLLFAQQAMRAGRRGGQSNLLDAVARFRSADQATRKLKGGSPHFGTAMHVLPMLYLMETQIAQGEARPALDAGKTHRTHLMGLGLEFDPALLARFRATLGEAALRAAMEGKPEAREEALETAKGYMVEAHKGLKSSGKKPGEIIAWIKKGAGSDWDPKKLYQVWKDIELWRGKPTGAIVALGAGAALLDPGTRLALANQMVELVAKRGGAEAGIRVLDGLIESSKGDATLIWYRGRTHFLRSIELRKERKSAPALAEVRLSRADFEQSVAKSPGFKNSTAIWLAYTWLAEAALEYAKEDWQATGKALVKSLAATPQAAEAMDYSGWPTRTYLEAVGGKYYGSRRYADAIALFDAALAHLPGDPKILSNKALMLRDWGNIVARRDRAKGKQLFEQSYAAYKLALKRGGNDVRLMNDAALIDVFYLHTEPDVNRRLLERAIEIGARLIETNKRNKDFNRAFVQEATGDACMNLGKLLLEHYKDLDAAEKVLKRGLTFPRPSQQDTRRLLQRVASERQKQQKEQEKKGEGEEPKKEEPVKK